MKAMFVIAAVAMLIAFATASKLFDLDNLDQIAKQVNSDCSLEWKAEVDHEFFQHLDDIDMGNMFGARNFDKNAKRPTNLRVKRDCEFETRVEDLPENFMTSDKFTTCSDVIKTVTDQSACGYVLYDLLPSIFMTM